jgi:hypothetical protein
MCDVSMENNILSLQFSLRFEGGNIYNLILVITPPLMQQRPIKKEVHERFIYFGVVKPFFFQDYYIKMTS